MLENKFLLYKPAQKGKRLSAHPHCRCVRSHPAPGQQPDLCRRLPSSSRGYKFPLLLLNYFILLFFFFVKKNPWRKRHRSQGPEAQISGCFWESAWKCRPQGVGKCGELPSSTGKLGFGSGGPSPGGRGASISSTRDLWGAWAVPGDQHPAEGGSPRSEISFAPNSAHRAQTTPICAAGGYVKLPASRDGDN